MKNYLALFAFCLAGLTAFGQEHRSAPVTGVNDENILLYPNPAVSSVTIKTPESMTDETYHIQIYNLQGTLVEDVIVILRAANLRFFDRYYAYMIQGKSFLKWCFAFSLVYNLTGIGFAVSGQLTPLVAAVLMPLSSVTVVGLATALTVSKRLPGEQS